MKKDDASEVPPKSKENAEVCPLPTEVLIQPKEKSEVLLKSKENSEILPQSKENSEVLIQPKENSEVLQPKESREKLIIQNCTETCKGNE